MYWEAEAECVNDENKHLMHHTVSSCAERWGEDITRANVRLQFHALWGGNAFLPDSVGCHPLSTPPAEGLLL